MPADLPARPPKIENCLFLPSAAAAHRLGFRPCLRCRPELTPGIAGWRGTANTVSRALHLIAEGALNEGGIETLADRLGVTARHLRRLFERHVGATPVSVGQAHRILFAKKLLGESGLPMADVAMAAGFGSIRRFNAVMRRTYARPPSALRLAGRSGTADATAGVTLALPYTPPYDWDGMIAFLRPRAIPGVEAVEADRYRRTFAVGAASGVLEVRPVPGQNCLSATIRTSDVAALGAIVSRLRRLFDLDADMAAIDAHLASDAALAERVRLRPGLRVPGAWDGFEPRRPGRPRPADHRRRRDDLRGKARFRARPPARALRRRQRRARRPRLSEPGGGRIGGPHEDRAHAGKGRDAAGSRAMAGDPHLLRPFETLEATVAKLEALPGIGPWTAQYIAMRALREPDAFPASDLGLLRAMATPEGRPTPAQLLARAEAWRPWRAYAAIRLWLQPGTEGAARAPLAAAARAGGGEERRVSR